MQKFRALISRRGKTPSAGTSTAKTSDAPCLSLESAQLQFGGSVPVFDALSPSPLGSHEYERMQLSEDACQIIKPRPKSPLSELASHTKRSDAKRKSIQFSGIASLPEPTGKQKKRFSLPLSGSGFYGSPGFLSSFDAASLSESDIGYVDPSKIQCLPKEAVSPKTKNIDFFAVVLNQEVVAFPPESKEHEAQMQDDLQENPVLTSRECRNETKSEEIMDRELGSLNKLIEINHASVASPEIYTTPWLDPITLPENWSSFSLDLESQDWSASLELCESDVQSSVPPTIESSLSSLLLPPDDVDFESDPPVNKLPGNSYSPQEYSHLDPVISGDIDSVLSDPSLYSDWCFEGMEVFHPQDFFLSDLNHEDSFLSKPNFPKPKSKLPPPRHSCPLCSKYGGRRAFARKDHLQQHLRTFHCVPKEELIPSFCPHSDCPKSAARASSRAFTTIVKYRHHLLFAHGVSMFDCKVSGCTRVGRWGFARETNLNKHMERYHQGGEKSEEERTSYFWRDHVDFLQYN